MKRTGFIILACLVSLLGSMRLWAEALKQDSTLEAISALPWNLEVRTSSSPDKDATDKTRITIHVHFSNPHVVADDEDYYIRFHKEDGYGWGSGTDKNRDGLNRWVNGNGHVEKIGKDGFDYHLLLDWQIDGEKQGKFNERFHCAWVKEQTFKKNGFTITLTVKVD